MKFTLSEMAISIKRTLSILVFICISVSAHSNTFLQSDSLQCEPSERAKKANIFNRTIKYLGKMLEQDPFYVRPHRFNMTLMPQYTYGYEYLNSKHLVSVGSFCSIASGQTIVPNDHRLDWVTTSSIASLKEFFFVIFI